jgi:hypothetical protein
MAKQSTTRLKELADAIPSTVETHVTMLTLESHEQVFSDYAIASIGAALVEKAIEVGILARAADLSEAQRKRILKQGLREKIKRGYALALFGEKTRDDLESIREIRISFAHSLTLLRFETVEVAKICAELHIPSTIKTMDRMLLATGRTETPRRRYIETTLTIAGRLKGTIATGKLVRLTPRGAEVIGSVGLR